MFTKFALFPYKIGSNSCNALKKSLPAIIIKLKNSKYKGKKESLVINWGHHTPPDYVNLNKTTALARNKLETFKALQTANLPTPDWTTDIEVAKSWLPDEVFARMTLTGQGGVGIVNFTGDQEAPLYTKYVKKKHEYRIHVFKDEVIDIQQKKRKHGVIANAKIRNKANGWIFARENINYPSDKALDYAKQAIKALNLDFGAVDMIYNQHQDAYYILEVNTAPGLENTTLDKYTKAFQNYAINP